MYTSPAPPTPLHVIDSPTPDKLVNRYLSTAAQYLNRTKSFHVTPTSADPVPNGQVVKRLAQSISANLRAKDNPHPLHDLGMPLGEASTSRLPVTGYPNDSIPVNKTQGFVNTLRRSLRKNKDRFYNKQSSTMKSCHSLNTYEQAGSDLQDMHRKVSMTPLMHHRRQPPAGNTAATAANASTEQTRKNTKPEGVLFFVSAHRWQNSSIILFTDCNVALIDSLAPCATQPDRRSHQTFAQMKTNAAT